VSLAAWRISCAIQETPNIGNYKQSVDIIPFSFFFQIKIDNVHDIFIWIEGRRSNEFGQVTE